MSKKIDWNNPKECKMYHGRKSNEYYQKVKDDPDFKLKKKKYRERLDVKQRQKESNKKWGEENKEKKRKDNKEWGEKNIERKKEYDKEYYQEHKEERKEYRQRPEVKAREKNYYKSDKRKQWRRKYTQEYYKKNPEQLKRERIRDATYRKHRKLKKGFGYHHNTEPYEADKFIILEIGFHNFYHKNKELFNMVGRI